MPLPRLLWRASPNFSARSARVDQIILHDCQGGYAGSVDWFARRDSFVSAHYVVREDGGEATQMVELADKAWHAMAFNSRSVGIEMAGYAEKGFSPVILTTAACMCAYLCHHLQIPVRHARAGVGSGIESHWGLGRSGGGHSDPSTDPAFMEKFVAMVASEAKRHDFPLVWEPEKALKACMLTPPEAFAIARPVLG